MFTFASPNKNFYFSILRSIIFERFGLAWFVLVWFTSSFEKNGGENNGGEKTVGEKT